jgi:hypothetical protein
VVATGPIAAGVAEVRHPVDVVIADLGQQSPNFPQHSVIQTSQSWVMFNNASKLRFHVSHAQHSNFGDMPAFSSAAFASGQPQRDAVM